MDFSFRNVTELLLFGVRGSMRTLPLARSQVNMLETRKREHSRKPDEQHDLIEACSPGPFLEMFARYPQDGWTAWGDEANDEVVPRGRPHRGYGGGELETLPHLDPHVRIHEGLADRLGGVLREHHESGSSIRQLATATGFSIARVRALLEKAGTSRRRQGRTANDSVDKTRLQLLEQRSE